MTNRQLSIRPAEQQDVPLILDFIKALADYEKLRHKVVATEDGLAQALFGDRPTAYVIIGEINGLPKGFALFFYSYSTFLGRPNLYLEDLYVAPSSRGSGLGKAMSFIWLSGPMMRAAGVWTGRYLTGIPQASIFMKPLARRLRRNGLDINWIARHWEN